MGDFFVAFCRYGRYWTSTSIRRSLSLKALKSNAGPCTVVFLPTKRDLASDCCYIFLQASTFKDFDLHSSSSTTTAATLTKRVSLTNQATLPGHLSPINHLSRTYRPFKQNGSHKRPVTATPTSIELCPRPNKPVGRRTISSSFLQPLIPVQSNTSSQRRRCIGSPTATGLANSSGRESAIYRALQEIQTYSPVVTSPFERRATQKGAANTSGLSNSTPALRPVFVREPSPKHLRIIAGRKTCNSKELSNGSTTRFALQSCEHLRKGYIGAKRPSGWHLEGAK